ncbi:MAG: MFS transporter [Burkholderiales bacterium]|nr:MFS transporter [Burkholderiales bacterium]
MSLPHGLRALESRDFRLYALGQGTSQTGIWLQMITTGWLLYEISGSSFLLGLGAFLQNIPFLFITPFAGVFLDRHELRPVLLVINVLYALTSAALFALVATGLVEPLYLLLGSLFSGILSAIDIPARQSLLIGLLTRRDALPNAIALNAALMTGARFVGPMIAGVVISVGGALAAYLLNTLMRLVGLAALYMVKHSMTVRDRGSESVLKQLAAGVRHVLGFKPGRLLLCLLAATSFTVQPYASLMPWFARERFGGGGSTLGMLIGAAGLGAMVGMVYLANRSSIRGLFRVTGWSAAIGSGGLLWFSLTGRLALANVALFLTGFGIMLTAAAVNTILQSWAPDALRARIASLYTVAFIGSMPLGALAAGALAERIGPPLTLTVFGGCTLAGVAVYFWRLAALGPAIEQLYDWLEPPPERASRMP